MPIRRTFCPSGESSSSTRKKFLEIYRLSRVSEKGFDADASSLAIMAGKQVGRLGIWSNDNMSFESAASIEAGVKAGAVHVQSDAHAAGMITGTAWLTCPKNGAPGRCSTSAFDGELKYWRLENQKVRRSPAAIPYIPCPMVSSKFSIYY